MRRWPWQRAARPFWQLADAADLAALYEGLALNAHLRATNPTLVFTGASAYRDSAAFWRQAAGFLAPDDPHRAFCLDRAQLMSDRAVALHLAALEARDA